MFRHRGKSRNLKHNLGIASLLSFVAGIVNVVGFFAVAKLTTNVTGHFAFMVEEALELNLEQSVFYFLYIACFFFGAFFSNFIIEFTNKITDKYIYIIPVIIEIVILISVGLLKFAYIFENPNLIACLLLFAMGLQNSLVTTISNSIVRTTHLTGLFTDLGIEISQLFFYETPKHRKKLISSINLRITIIFFFFAGGIFAGRFYLDFKTKTLLFAALFLFIGVIIDALVLRIRQKKVMKKKYRKVYRN